MANFISPANGASLRISFVFKTLTNALITAAWSRLKQKTASYQENFSSNFLKN